MKFKALLLNIFFIFSIFSYIPSSAIASVPELSAESAILIDAHSGRVLYAKNEHQRRPNASTTKIVTALLALEKGNLANKVTISKRAAETGEASVWLEEGEQHTFEDLIYAMMLPSANDASVAIAEHVGGSVENFAGLMNQRMKKLGLKNSNFVTPNGLHHPDHFTTAYDLAFVTKEALKIPMFREIITTERREIPWEGSEWSRVLVNKNKLLYRYEEAIGVKNGFTRQAGNCLVSAAQKDGLTLIAVVLKSNKMYDESQALLEYGLETFKPVKVISRGEIIRNVDVINGTKNKVQVVSSEEVVIPVKAEETTTIKKNLALVQALEAPVKVGSKAGILEVSVGNKSFAKIDLVTAEGADTPRTFMISLWETFLAFLQFLT